MTSANSSLLAEWNNLFVDAGLDEATQVFLHKSDSFGNGKAILELEGLGIKLVRERGQDFLEIASAPQSSTWFQFDDVCVALGWRQTKEIVAKERPNPLSEDLALINRNQAPLAKAFQREQYLVTLDLLHRAAKAREDAFSAKLKRLADENC